MSATVISPRRPGHHFLTSSGVVQARYTRCRGALTVRVIRISVSLGNVTSMVLCCLCHCRTPFQCPSSVFVFEVIQHVLEEVEPFLPEVLVAGNPVVDGLERLRIQPVHALPAFIAHDDGAHLAQHPQVP